MKILYNCQLVLKPADLQNKYPSQLPIKYYHHSTNKFKPMNYDNREGLPLRLKIVGRITTDKVDALLVKNPNSMNEFPHITLATADGIKPFYSNIVLKEHPELVEWFDKEDFVDTIFTNIVI